MLALLAFSALLPASLTRPALSAAPSLTEHVLAPVFLGREPIGEVDLELTRSNDLVSIEGTGLLVALQPYLIPSKYAEIKTRINSQDRLVPSVLRASGIGLEYSAALLELRLDVPLDIRRDVDIRLGAGAYAASGPPPLAPADVSSYLNLRAGRDYLSGSTARAPGWQSTIVDLDGAATALDTTLESLGTYRSGGSSRGWSRGDTRLVHDLVDDRVRLSAGDLRYSTDGFQTFQRAGGVAVGRAFGLQPYRSSAPVGQSTLLIDRPSRVDVIVNGQRVQTLNLGPGRYNVRDLPYATGTNDVTLRITDEVGRTQTINFPFIFDSTVLGAGEHDFNYAMGVAATPSRRGRRYDRDQPLFSVYHAYGITDQVTVGANAQADETERMGGVEGRWATALGTLRGDVAGSNSDDAAPGYALRLQHRYIDGAGLDPRNRSIELSGTYRSPYFVSLGSPVPSNPVALDLGARYGQRLERELYGSLGVSRQFGRRDTNDAYSVDLSFSKPLGETINASLLLSQTQTSIGSIDRRLFIALSWFPSGTGHSVTTTHDTHNRHSQAQWHYSPPHHVDAVEADVVAERNVTERVLRAEADYTGYRFEAGAFQGNDYDRTGSNLGTRRTSLTFGTALAFADGHVAVTRPIDDSFAIVPAHPSLAGHAVEVNPDTAGPDAKADFWGPGVWPDLPSYYRSQVRIDAPDLPEGLDLGPDLYSLTPRYRTGTVVPAGTGATVLLEVLLVDPAGEPMDLELGAVTLEAAPERPPIDFFTSRAGRLRVAGIVPGGVVIRLRNYPELPLRLDIPEDARGVYDAGRITVPIDDGTGDSESDRAGDDKAADRRAGEGSE